jgi:hypothetical protein
LIGAPSLRRRPRYAGRIAHSALRHRTPTPAVDALGDISIGEAGDVSIGDLHSGTAEVAYGKSPHGGVNLTLG